MLIGVMADSHDNMGLIAKAVETFNTRKVKLVIHGGDYVAPFTVRELEKLNCEFIGVFGNNDGEKRGLKEKISSIGDIFEPPLIFDLADKKFMVTHDRKDAESFIKKDKPDILIYAHTHVPKIEENEILSINPGECGGWLKGKSSIAVLNIETMKAEIVEL